MPSETLPILRVLSLGAGVQSTTLLLMNLRDKFREKLDYAIFADTGWEPAGVYEHLAWLEEQAAQSGLPTHRVSAGDLRRDLLAAAAGTRKRVANPPFYVRNQDEAGEYAAPDQGGMLWRSCTKEYKVQPIRRHLRKLLRRWLGSSKTPSGSIEQWFGISGDEQQRVRFSRDYWITNRYPLIERSMTRVSCLEWLRRNGFPEPPKSACIGCPYHSNAVWRDMKLHRPAEFADAVVMDEAIRHGVPGVKGEAYLHRSMLPLATVDLRNDIDRGQGVFEFAAECSGHCGV